MPCGFFQGFFACVEDELCFVWSLVGGRNASKFWNLSGPCFFIKPLGITLLINFDGGITKNFKKLPLGNQRTSHVSIGLVGRNKGGDGNDIGFTKKFRNFTNAAEVFFSIIRRKSKIFIQPMADIITI